LGNICRSPMAEFVLRAQLEKAGLDGQVEVDSAGTGTWHVGEGADERALAVLHRAGYSSEVTSRHAAKLFDIGWFRERDLILALDRNNLAALRQLAPDDDAASRIRLLRSYDPDAAGNLDVPDPFYGGPEGFEHVLALVERACAGLVAQLQQSR
jgi:protein-tyrosine phosphatase